MNGIGAKMSDVANSTNQIQFYLFASGGKISAPATRSLFTFPMNATLNFPPLTGTHDATRKANLPLVVHLDTFSLCYISFRTSDGVPLIFLNQSLFDEFQGITLNYCFNAY